jgi:Na+/proline symporter
MGKGGGYLVVIMLFMAITSTGSAECIAVSSLVAYDIYRKYYSESWWIHTPSLHPPPCPLPPVR